MTSECHTFLRQTSSLSVQEDEELVSDGYDSDSEFNSSEKAPSHAIKQGIPLFQQSQLGSVKEEKKESSSSVEQEAEIEQLLQDQ